MFGDGTGRLASDLVHVAPGTVSEQMFVAIPVQHGGDGIRTFDDAVFGICIVSGVIDR